MAEIEPIIKKKVRNNPGPDSIEQQKKRFRETFKEEVELTDSEKKTIAQILGKEKGGHKKEIENIDSLLKDFVGENKFPPSKITETVILINKRFIKLANELKEYKMKEGAGIEVDENKKIATEKEATELVDITTSLLKKSLKNPLEELISKKEVRERK